MHARTHTYTDNNGSKEGNVLFKGILSTFYLRSYGRKEMFYLKAYSAHVIYGYMEGRKCFI